MLDNIFGIGIAWYYMIGVLLLALGLAKVAMAGKYCYRSLRAYMEDKPTTGHCITSIKQLGMLFTAIAVYAVILVLISAYVIVYGFQNGWSSVYTLDLAFAGGYLFLIAVILIK